MIIKTTIELKTFFSITSEFDFDAFAPYLDAVLENHLHPYISKAQYDNLNTGYNSTMSTAQSDLIRYAQAPLVYMAMYEYSFLGDKTIGNNGITTNTGEDGKMAAQWRIEDLRESCLRLYGTELDKLLNFLEANKDVYTLWALSTSYTIFKECFVNTTGDFHSIQNISSSRRTFMALKPIMKRVEDLQIKSITGEALFNQIKTQIRTNAVTSANDKLLAFIKPAVCSMSIARGIVELAFEVTADGLVVKTTSQSLTQNVKSAPMPLNLAMKLEQAREDGNVYKEQLKKYLLANHADYPLYEADATVYNSSGTTDINKQDSSLFMM